MAKPRRITRRRVSRKHRSTAKKGTRRNGVFGYAYKPVNYTLRAADDVTRATTNTIRNIISTGLSGIDRVGKRVTNRADNVVNSILMRKRKTNRRKY